MTPETMVIWLKISGATIGSSIAVVFQPGNDSNRTLVKRFVIGVILGVISAPIILDFFTWPHTPDYWLAASCIGGLIGYLLLQWVFTRELLLHLLKIKRQ